MTSVIRIVALANGGYCPYGGQWLKSYDPEAFGGQGDATFTDRIADAIHFLSVAEAMQLWATQSRTCPLRPDGRPNKPLTAFTVEIETLV